MCSLMLGVYLLSLSVSLSIFTDKPIHICFYYLVVWIIIFDSMIASFMLSAIFVVGQCLDYIAGLIEGQNLF